MTISKMYGTAVTFFDFLSLVLENKLLIFSIFRV